MRYKKITMLMILAMFLFVCSLSTISAANQTISTGDTDGIRGAINNASVNPGDTIFLQPGTYNKTGNDTNFTISKNITLQGNGSKDSIIIDAQGLSRIFTINNNLNVTFINLTFINGRSTTAGAIYNSYANTTITIINCSFINNTGTSSGGAAVHISGTNSTVVSTVFINNTAIGASGSGALYINGPNGTVTNSTFINNHASSDGGAIYFNVANGTVINCTFIDNSAASDSGAIRSNGLNTAVINSTFINNTAVEAGGAIYTYGTNFTVVNSIFINNSVTSGSGGAVAKGSYNGAGNDFTMVNSTFINNAASTYAGALYSSGGNNTTVIGCNFINNSANYIGGAYFARDVIMADCNFVNNSATTTYCGGAYFSNNTIVIDCNFVNNSAVTNGGGVFNRGVNCSFTGCIFVNNSANLGGGFYQSSVANNTIVNRSIFIDNSATENGGAIFNAANLSVSKNTMSGNAAGLGQMIYNNGTIGILNLTFIDNSTWIVKNGSTITLYAYLVDDMGNTVTGQNISFYLNGIFFENATSIEGYANITYKPSNSGDIPVSGVYAGNGEYNILINNGLLQIRIPTNIIVSVPEKVKVGDTVTIESKLTDEDGNPIANATVDFYVDGKKVGFGVTDSNGVAKLNYTFNKAGKPKVEAKFAGDNTYLASNATNKTTVSKIPTIITIKTDKKKILVTLTDENGNLLANKKLTIKIKGKTFTRITDANGQVIIKFPNANKYKVTAKFAGDNRYYSSSAMVPGESEPDEPRSDVLASGKVAMKSTGIPIIAALLTLIASIGLIIRKKE